jgi:hypothetical protein
MKVEDVPDAWMHAAWEAWALAQDDAAGVCMKHALAAVIPAIQNAALERAAVWHDEQAAEMSGPDRDGESNATATMRRIAAEQHRNSAAAIRALKEGT